VWDALRARGASFIPDLTAATGLNESAVRTALGDLVAAGLAASLSETGEGNVLLVDMHVENGVAHDFHHGKLACGLDDALEVEKRSEAMVQDNLYMVREAANGKTANGDKLPRVLPKRFNHLMPRLKASDYDYIIFDMPAISQISVTARLSRFMDMVLLVVESEKTDRDIVKRATTLLSEPNTNVGIILNKSRAYVPRLLQQEL
jgi:Mrp family chromosome partitioning ATPase